MVKVFKLSTNDNTFLQLLHNKYASKTQNICIFVKEYHTKKEVTMPALSKDMI